MKFTLISLLLFTFNSFASDHIDGPVTTSHAASDITDLFAFPSPQRKEFLTVILNTYPFVPSNGHFADKVNYQILIREAKLGSVIQTSKGVSFFCSFFTPYDHSKHTVECKSSIGTVTKAKINAIKPFVPGSTLDVFAGHRSDPFFFNADWAKAVSNTGVLNPPKPQNTMDQLNVLSIVLEIDVRAHFGPNHSEVLAIAAQMITQDGPSSPKRRLDRVGRPEITNVTLVARQREDLRDMYNLEAPFQNSQTAIVKYKARISSNISFYDKLDGKEDWSPASKEALVNLLADDFLVIDLSKPCSGDNFLEIEKSLVMGIAHKTCGGRKPTDDIMDTLFGYYINQGKRALAQDGVRSPFRPVTNTFPYLSSADTSISAKLKALIARKFFSE